MPFQIVPVQINSFPSQGSFASPPRFARLTSVLVQGPRELVDCRRDLQALLEDSLLALQADVFGPFDVAGQVACGLHVVANAKVPRGRLEQRVLGRLGGLGRLGRERRSGDFLAGRGGLFRCHCVVRGVGGKGRGELVTCWLERGELFVYVDPLEVVSTYAHLRTNPNYPPTTNHQPLYFSPSSLPLNTQPTFTCHRN